MTAILHHGLKICFVLNFPFIYFQFPILTFISRFYLDFCFSFLHRLIFPCCLCTFSRFFHSCVNFLNSFSIFLPFYFNCFSILSFYSIAVRFWISSKFLYIIFVPKYIFWFFVRMFFFQVETKKNCCLGPSNRLWQQIEPHLNWQYPSINHPR